MALSLVIGGLTCAGIILSVLFMPQIKIKRFTLSTYCLCALAGAACVLIFGCVSPSGVLQGLSTNSEVNPIKILVLFICMTLLSVFLDEAGFFEWLASVTLSHAGHSQKRLFLLLFVTVSVLTVFTSNDIVILTFTPFICRFAAHAGVDPVPYLVSEFVAANTWSMALIIGNPTNIYVASSVGMDFISYFKVMALPAAAAGITAYAVLRLIFRKRLASPIEPREVKATITDKFSAVTGGIILASCTLVMAVGSYFGLEMWLVALISAALLYAISLFYALVRRRRPAELIGCTKRAPFVLVPFVLSMFIIVLALKENGVITLAANAFGSDHAVLKYGVASFFVSDITNNIPMSVLFAPIVNSAQPAVRLGAAYGTVIGSNIGAFLTPVGALAGIMWMSLLKQYDVRFTFARFVEYGAATSLPVLSAALLTLSATI